MNYRRDQFTVQPVPLYEFRIEGGQLVRIEHFRYNVMYGKIAYQIYTDTGIKSKKQDQLDVALNGRVWTFDGSYRNALEHFRIRANEDLVRAAIMSETARQNMLDVQTAETNLDPAAI